MQSSALYSDVVRVEAKKCDGYLRPVTKQFSIDPKLTTFESLRLILAKAFKIEGNFVVSYLSRGASRSSEARFLPMLSDWDYNAAVLGAGESVMTLKVDVRPFDEGLQDWDVIDNDDLIKLSNGIISSHGESSASADFNAHLKHSDSLPSDSSVHKSASDTFEQQHNQPLAQHSCSMIAKSEAKQRSTSPFLVGNISRVVSAITGSSGGNKASEPTEGGKDAPRGPVTDTEFRSFLDDEGRLVKPNQFRCAVYQGGVEPALRKVVWRLLLNIYPDGMTGNERIAYTNALRDEYNRLKDTWQRNMRLGHITEELRVVANMVRKDAVRTDRFHDFYAGSDDENENVLNLFNILTTYALTHPDVSYCQGMSDLASPLLFVMENEADAYVCFCALMQRMKKNFMCDGRSMTKKFQHLIELLQFYDPVFFEYLREHHAEDLLFCYRWLLLSLKREFVFSDALLMLEVSWSCLPPDPPPPGQRLSLFDVDISVTMSNCCVAPSPSLSASAAIFARGPGGIMPHQSGCLSRCSGAFSSCPGECSLSSSSGGADEDSHNRKVTVLYNGLHNQQQKNGDSNNNPNSEVGPPGGNRTVFSDNSIDSCVENKLLDSDGRVISDDSYSDHSCSNLEVTDNHSSLHPAVVTITDGTAAVLTTKDLLSNVAALCSDNQQPPKSSAADQPRLRHHSGVTMSNSCPGDLDRILERTSVSSGGHGAGLCHSALLRSLLLGRSNKENTVSQEEFYDAHATIHATSSLSGSYRPLFASRDSTGSCFGSVYDSNTGSSRSRSNTVFNKAIFSVGDDEACSCNGPLLISTNAEPADAGTCLSTCAVSAAISRAKSPRKKAFSVCVLRPIWSAVVNPEQQQTESDESEIYLASSATIPDNFIIPQVEVPLTDDNYYNEEHSHVNGSATFCLPTNDDHLLYKQEPSEYIDHEIAAPNSFEHSYEAFHLSTAKEQPTTQEGSCYYNGVIDTGREAGGIMDSYCSWNFLGTAGAFDPLFGDVSPSSSFNYISPLMTQSLPSSQRSLRPSEETVVADEFLTSGDFTDCRTSLESMLHSANTNAGSTDITTKDGGSKKDRKQKKDLREVPLADYATELDKALTRSNGDLRLSQIYDIVVNKGLVGCGSASEPSRSRHFSTRDGAAAANNSNNNNLCHCNSRSCSNVSRNVTCGKNGPLTSVSQAKSLNHFAWGSGNDAVSHGTNSTVPDSGFSDIATSFTQSVEVTATSKNNGVGEMKEDVGELVAAEKDSKPLLPPPNECGDGNPFKLFLCLSLLLQHRDLIMKKKMDYNEIAMYFDKLVRKHDVHKVLRFARRLFRDYLRKAWWETGS